MFSRRNSLTDPLCSLHMARSRCELGHFVLKIPIEKVGVEPLIPQIHIVMAGAS
jgi:hypothetical protein